MKKVLIISYSYNDYKIGSVRPRGLVKHLPSFGWQAVVLSAEANLSQIRDTKLLLAENHSLRYAVRKKMTEIGVQATDVGIPILPTGSRRSAGALVIRLWDEILSHPDSSAGWWNSVEEHALLETLDTDTDAIISTSLPFTSHVVARRLKNWLDCPWIADYRDLWSQSHYYEKSAARLLIDRHTEHRTTRQADAITTVSEPLAIELRKMHPDKIVRSIPNGIPFCESNDSVELTSRFSIMYTGQLYRGKRNPEMLFSAVKCLIDRGIADPSDIVIDFVGPDSRDVLPLAENLGVGNLVRSHNPTSRTEALRLQRSSHVLLILTSTDPKECGVYTGKLYDYMSSMRPILSIGREDSVIKELLETTRSGTHVSCLEDAVTALTDMYLEFKSAGFPKCRCMPEQMNRLSQREMARKFADLLNTVVE